MAEKRPRLMVLNEPDGRRFSRALSMEIGRDHAEVFLQMEYLLSISTTPLIDGELWTRQSVADLQEKHFPYWGKTFIAGILNDLTSGYQHIRYTITGAGRTRKRLGEKVQIQPLLKEGHFNEWGMDVTKWYALNIPGIKTLKSVMMDEQAVAVSVARKRNHRHTATHLQTSGNGFPDDRQPVPASSATYITEISTETSAVVVVPEFPPLPTDENETATATFLGEEKEFSNTHPILTTRIYSTKERASIAERVYLLVRPNQVAIPAKDKDSKSQVVDILISYLEKYGNEEQAAIALKTFAIAWDEKYKRSSQTNLTWLTSWAAAGSLPQSQKQKSSVVISDEMYCEIGKPLFNATLDESSPDFSKHYRAWMAHQSGCEECQGKKKAEQPAVSRAPRSNPLKAAQLLAERESV